jgi:hypothetical protein
MRAPRSINRAKRSFSRRVSWSVCWVASAGSLEVEGGGQATQGVTGQAGGGPGAALLAVQQAGLDEL